MVICHPEYPGAYKKNMKQSIFVYLQRHKRPEKAKGEIDGLWCLEIWITLKLGHSALAARFHLVFELDALHTFKT